MAINSPVPDYDLEDTLELTTAEQVRAISDPLRTTILGLLHERAATVTELATAVKRPKSTVAHHVKVLADAGILRVVRTRRVRAIEERYYGRAARMFYYGLGRRSTSAQDPPDPNDLEVAAKESEGAYDAGQLRSFIRHARIPEERAAEFWRRVMPIIHEFDKLPRSGDTTYGFTVGLFPIFDYPTLPPTATEAEEDPSITER
ncbi:winged helix-turn-helix domain-containing protein [Kribbella sp. NBC_01245]|uniref:ArsR/SmtB family transcription factor n=1 Tax=Kribbella sp. NBC_01245 TaxID=2903578 RepID=UPI002E2B9247|nr:winged helix-turn-helix domain-containing protein [Kribbella sp. NBC_01245]